MKQHEEQGKMTTYSTHEWKGIQSRELIEEGFGIFKKNETGPKWRILTSEWFPSLTVPV